MDFHPVASIFPMMSAEEFAATKKRRKTTSKERLTPCSACGYPLSQRHHLLDVAYHGENDMTIQLCANCHELYHLIESAYIQKSKYAQRLLGKFLLRYGSGKGNVQFLMNKVNEADEIMRVMSIEACRIVEGIE